MKCTQCGTEVPGAKGAKSIFLCSTCRKQLYFICIECGAKVSNRDNQSPSFFRSRSVCSETCRRQRIRKAKLTNNPMKRDAVVQKGAQTKIDRYGRVSGFRGPMPKEERDMHSRRMREANPMKNPKIAQKQGEVQRRNHASDPLAWKEKYRDAKFQHFISLANGTESIGAQRSGANPSATDFFTNLIPLIGWENDEVFYDEHPYEYPLIISKTAKICYFPDFFNRTKGIIIEWDESAHKYGKIATKDKRRDSQILKKYPNLKIIRLDASERDKVQYIQERL